MHLMLIYDFIYTMMQFADIHGFFNADTALSNLCIDRN